MQLGLGRIIPSRLVSNLPKSALWQVFHDAVANIHISDFSALIATIYLRRPRISAIISHFPKAIRLPSNI